MPHFLIDKNCINNNEICVKDTETVLHLGKALRIKRGEVVKFICDEIVYKTRIWDISKSEIKGEVLSFEKSTRKLDFELCAAISVLKPEGMHLAIENAVQSGAKEIYTVFSDNCAVKKENAAKRVEKWRKIGEESFKQCERADVPRIFDTLKFEEIFSKFKTENIIIFAEKYDEFTLSKALLRVNKKEKILAVFGPEGGFSEAEFKYFKSKNLKLTTLGKLIYKAPNAVTAGLFGITECLMMK